MGDEGKERKKKHTRLKSSITPLSVGLWKAQHLHFAQSVSVRKFSQQVFNCLSVCTIFLHAELDTSFIHRVDSFSPLSSRQRSVF